MPSNGVNSADGSLMNQGNKLGDRPSSRVTAPPGGKSSISFGGGDEAPPKPKQERAVGNKSSISFGGEAAPPPKQARKVGPGGQSSISFGGDEAPQPKPASKAGGKVLSEVDKTNLPAAGLPARKQSAASGDQGDKAQKPARVPPGGKSSIVF